MDYRIWVELLGHTAEEPVLKQRLKDHGVTKKLVMPRDETDLSVQVRSICLDFQDESLFEDLPPVGEGNCVLTGVIMFFDYPRVEAYDGPVPYGIAKTDSQAELRKKFGEPIEVSPYDEWDSWAVENNLRLTAVYKDDKNSLESLTISLPEP